MNYKNSLLFSFLLLFISLSGFTQSVKSIVFDPSQIIKIQSTDNPDSLSCLIYHPEIFFTSDGLIHYIGIDSDRESVSLNNSSWIEVPRKISHGQTIKFKSVNFPSGILSERNVIGVWNANSVIIATQFDIKKQNSTSAKINTKVNNSGEGLNSILTGLPFQSGRWVKVKVTEEGVYSIKRSDLIRFGFSGSEDGTKLQVFSSSGKNAGLLGTTEIPLWTKLTEQPEISDDQTYFFYTTINQGISFIPETKKFGHFLDIFDQNHYIYIGFGIQNGKRMTIADYSNIATIVTYTDGKDLVWGEQEKENLLKSGTHWLGQSLIENSSVVLTPKLQDYKKGTSIDFQTVVVSRHSSSFKVKFSIYDHSNLLLSDSTISGVALSNYDGVYANQKTLKAVIPAIEEDRLKLIYQYTSKSSANGWIDWFEAEYTKSLLNQKNDISFYISSKTNTNGLIQLKGFPSSNISVLNINDEFNPIKVNSVINGGDVEYKWPIEGDKANRFFVFDQNSGTKSLNSFSVVTRFDFSEINGQTNYIIISPDLFYDSAIRLLDHRNKQGWKGVVIRLENIYDAYSGGKQSIYAIRQFLKDIFTTYNKNTSDLFNVLLFGDTSYDYKGIITSSQYKCFIPSFESEIGYFDQGYSFVSDDFYSTLFQGNKFEIGVGRLPITSVSDAEAVVTKLIDYDEKSVFGDWRNTVTFVADDGLTSDTDDGDLHTSNAETVGNAPFVPKSIIKNKIYLINYQTEISSDGRRKPDVTRDLISTMNAGTVIVNYSGHGNSKVWTHERVLEISTFLPKLSNYSNLPFIITATCDFGRLDDDDSQSAAELFVLKPDGGSIGMFTTTRLVSTSRDITGTYNLAINYALFRYLFNKNTSGENLSAGEIYKLTKNRIASSDNNVQKFALLADPAMRLLLPGTTSNLTKQSGSYSLTDSLKIKSQTLTSLSGEVYKSDGTLNSEFNGEIAFRLKSEPRTITIPEWKNYYTSSFEMEGQDVFKGTSSVINGKFSTQFIVPKDVTVNQKSAKISGYYWNESQDGYLNTPKIFFETNSDFIQTDSVGPEVNLYFNDPSFVNGQTVSAKSELIADILDSSGVNTTGLGIGHQLLGILDNNINESIDLSSYYSAAKDDFRKGRVKFPISSLNPGSHSFELRVWDSFNNGAVKKVDFVIGNSDEFATENLLPYPNPFSQKVYLYFNHNQTDGNFKISAKIYTSNGLLIQSIKKDVSSSNNADFIEWDGIDSDGDHVANGIYLINISIEDLKSGKRIHKIAKVFYLK